jgi:hypothetical protein
MGKVGGNYPAVFYGVSEQEPQDRRPGQMEQQDNMLPDPVRGLVRRRPTRHMDEVSLGTGEAQWLVEAQRMREFTFVIDGVEYSFLHRKEPSALGEALFAYLFNKTSGQFIPITYENSTWVDDLIAGGVSAVTCVGRYLYIAGNTTIPAATQTEPWNDEDNRSKLAAWVRSGAYSRKYTITLVKPDGSTVVSSYETKPSAYPELLDTSDIPFYLPGTTDPDPEYQKKVNDRVNEYNGLMSEWTKLAADDIQPENIAEKLAEALITDHSVAASNVRGTVVVDDADYVDIRCDDGADGQTFVAVGKEISDPVRVTRVHWHGKVIRVRPTGASETEAYYLKAVAETEGDTGFTNVTWFESAGVISQPTRMFAQLIIDGGAAYLAQDGAGLEALAPSTGEHPDYKPSTVGDGRSSPLPNFVGKRITMLSVFQDRLLVGTDGIVNCSRPGDYLSFFRKTVLTISDDDPIEMFAQGSEGDTLRSSVLYDRDLIVFGDLRQYAISGRAILSAKAPNISAISAHEHSAEAHPVASGNFVFLAKSSDGRTSVHQLQIGNLTAAPVGYEVSQQLDSYLSGSPLQLCAITAPNMVCFRTRDNPQHFYLYRYVDDQSGGQRQVDAWFRFLYAEPLGSIIGMSPYRGDLYIFTMRPTGAPGGAFYVVADRLSLNPTKDSHPHLDSWREYPADDGWHGEAVEQLHAAASDSSEKYLLGCAANATDELIEQEPGIEDHLKLGVISPGRVLPTNPYMLDQNGRAILGGRLTLGNVILSLDDTGGFSAYRKLRGNTSLVKRFEGRVVGNSDNLLDTQPIFRGQITLPLGGETRDLRYWIDTESWLPLRITGIEWNGQSFYRVRRVS